MTINDLEYDYNACQVKCINQISLLESEVDYCIILCRNDLEARKLMLNIPKEAKAMQSYTANDNNLLIIVKHEWKHCMEECKIMVEKNTCRDVWDDEHHAKVIKIIPLKVEPGTTLENLEHDKLVCQTICINTFSYREYLSCDRACIKDFDIRKAMLV